jgi:P2-related tail formation protein
MIPLKYRERLPSYWYENTVAEYHYEGAGSEMDRGKQAIIDLGNQFLLPYATYSLDVWDWIFFGQVQRGTNQKRRDDIKKKYLSKARFTLTTLRTIGAMAGALRRVSEDFPNKRIYFDFEAIAPLDLESLYADFERIRPVHVNSSPGVTLASRVRLTMASCLTTGEQITVYPWSETKLQGQGTVKFGIGYQTTETVSVYPA